MSYELSIIAPCLNEARNLPEFVQRLRKVFESKGIDGEIVLVDDGSTDETPELIDRLAKEVPGVTAVHHDENRGIAAGWATGLEASSGRLVGVIDTDLQYVPEDVWRLYREHEESPAELVQGFRSPFEWDRDLRYWLSRGLNFILNSLFSMRLRDNKSGFVICRRDVLADILDYRFNYRYFQTFIAISGAGKGYDISEVEVIFQRRLAGESFISGFPLGFVAGTASDLGKAFVEFRLGKRKGLPRSLDAYIARLASRSDERSGGGQGARFRGYTALLPLVRPPVSRSAAHRYRELRQSQWLSTEQIRALQERKLEHLIHHAYGHVPYYRELFDSRSLRPSDIRSSDDLPRLPALTRDLVRANRYFELLSDNHDKRRMQRIATSANGEPLTCYVDQHQLEMRWAAGLRSMEWTGWSFGERQASLWHDPTGSALQVGRKRLDWALQRRRLLRALELSDETVDEYAKEIRRSKPALINGYAQSLDYLARRLADEAGRLQVDAIVAATHELPPESREVMEREMHGSVFDTFGTPEFSTIAHECEAHEGLHVTGENYIVEILTDGRRAEPGETGEVVLTDLNNYCMPFLRYQLGVRAQATEDVPCACGRGLPTIGAIEGTVLDMIIGTNGNHLPHAFFGELFKDQEHMIRRFDLTQPEPGRIRLGIIKAPRFDPDAFELILAELQRHVGEDMVIDVDFLDLSAAEQPTHAGESAVAEPRVRVPSQMGTT